MTTYIITKNKKPLRLGYKKSNAITAYEKLLAECGEGDILELWQGQTGVIKTNKK